MRWWMGVCFGVLLCLATVSHADDRRKPPWLTDEHWEGYRTWRPDRDRRGLGPAYPDRFTIDKRGKCEVRCVRDGRDYKCKEYRC
jgi:hypothetical protein